MRAERRSRAVLAGAILTAQLAVLVVSFALQRPNGPVLFRDETGFLTAAWNFSSRTGDAVIISSQLYSPGYSVLLAPLLSVVPGDPWRIAVGFNLACALVLPIVLWRFLVAELNIDERRAALIAAAAGMYPAVTMQTSRAWPEVVLVLIVTCWALAAGRYLRTQTVASSIAVGIIGGLSYGLHHRMLGLVVVTLVVCAWPAASALRRRSERIRRSLVTDVRPAFIGLAMTVVGLAASVGLDRVVTRRVYLDGAVEYGNVLTTALHPSGIRATAEHIVGHVWYGQVASLGLLAVAAVASMTSRRKSPIGMRLIVLAAYSSTLVISAIFLSQRPRVDQLVYGRYAEVWMPLIVAIGLTALLGRERNIWRAAVGSGYVTLALTAIMVASVGNAFFDQSPTKVTVPAILGWDLLAGDRNSVITTRLDVWVIATAAILVGTSLVLVALRTDLAIVLYAAVFFLLAGTAGWWSLRPWFNNFEYTGTGEAALLVEQGAPALGFTDDVTWESRNAVQYHSGFLTLTRIDPTGECPDVPYLLAPTGTVIAFAVDPVMEMSPFGGTIFEVTC